MTPPKKANAILEDVAEEYEIKVKDLTGRGRTQWVSLARAEAALRLLETGRAQAQVGKILGGRDHTTIRYLAGQAKSRREEAGDVERNG